MRFLCGWLARLRGLFHGAERDRELAEELEYHVQAHAEELTREGIPPDEARRRAVLQLGGVERVSEAYRDQRGVPLLENVWRDVLFSVRSLRKTPGFAAVAVLSLSVAIGMGTAVFSHVNAVLLRSLPVPDPRELRVLLWGGTEVRMPSYEGVATQAGNRWTGADCVPHPLFLRLREQAAGMADVFGFAPIQGAVVRVGDEAFVARGTMVSESFFSGLKARPMQGRLLHAGEDFSGAMNVVISHGWWRRYFSLDPGAIGRTIVLDRTPYTVVGVLPPGFPSVRPGDPGDFYVPMAAGSPFLYRPIDQSFHWFVRVMARTRTGTTDSQLQAALNVAFAHETAQVMREPSVRVEPGRGGVQYDRNAYGKPLLLLLGVVGLVTLVACANLASLSLARGAARESELALRASLGAGRWRLIQQSLSESLLLAISGGGVGLLLAFAARGAIGRLLARPDGAPRGDASLDLSVLGFGLLLVAVTAVLSGILPALRAGQVDPVEGLKSRGSLGAPRLRAGRVLVVAQVCLSLSLLTGAGLFVRSLINLTGVDPGFAVDKLLLVNLNSRASSYAQAHGPEFYQRVQEAVAGLPGVQSATVQAFPLLADLSWSGDFSIAGHPIDGPAEACRFPVGDTFFQTFGIPVLRGRGFESGDGPEAAKVVVVNESFARRYLDGVDPVGLTCSILGADWRIVGVSADAKYDSLKKPPGPTVYFPIWQMFLRPSLSKNFQAGYVVARTSMEPPTLASAARKVVAEIDPAVAVTGVTTQEEVRDRSIHQERVLASLCAMLAGVAVALSCIGIYGLVAYNVARRTGEIAIRMAIGARPGMVARSVLREAVVMAGAGVALGLPAAFVVTRFIESHLYGVRPHDPVTFLSVAAVLVVAAVAAAWFPARRAARVDPMIALRNQ